MLHRPTGDAPPPPAAESVNADELTPTHAGRAGMLYLHPADDFDESVLAQTAREELTPGGDLVETLKRLRNLNRAAELMPLCEQPDEVSKQWADDHNNQLVARLQLERTLHAQLDHITRLEMSTDAAQSRELKQLQEKADKEEAELAEAMAQLTQSYRKLRSDAVVETSAKMKFKAIGARSRVSGRQEGAEVGEPLASSMASGATLTTALPLRSFSGRSFKMDLPPPPSSPLRAEAARSPTMHELDAETRVLPADPGGRQPAHSPEKLTLPDAPLPPANLEAEMKAIAEPLGVEAMPARQSTSAPSDSGSPLPRYLQVELHEGAQKMLCPDDKPRVSPPAAAEKQQHTTENSAFPSARYSHYPPSVQTTVAYAEHAGELMPSTTSAMMNHAVDVPVAVDEIAERRQPQPGMTQDSSGQLLHRARTLLQHSDTVERTSSVAALADSAGVHGPKHPYLPGATSSYSRPGMTPHGNSSDSISAPAKPSPRSSTPPRRRVNGGAGSSVPVRSPARIRARDASRIRDRAERLSDRFEQRQQESHSYVSEVGNDTFSLHEYAKLNPATSLGSAAPRGAVVATVKPSHRDPGTRDLEQQAAPVGFRLNFGKLDAKQSSMRAKSPVTIRTGPREQTQSITTQSALSDTYSASTRIGTLDRLGVMSSQHGVLLPASRRGAMLASAEMVKRGPSPVRVRFLGESPRERDERLSMSGRSYTPEFSGRILQQAGSTTLSFEDPRLLKRAERAASIASQEGDSGLHSGAGVLERLRIGIESGDLDSAIYSWDAKAERPDWQHEQRSEQLRSVSGPLQFAQRIVARAGSAPQMHPSLQQETHGAQSFATMSSNSSVRSGERSEGLAHLANHSHSPVVRAAAFRAIQSHNV